MMNTVLSSETRAIRDLNDKLRQRHEGGVVLTTAGIAALGEECVAKILAAIAAFDDFSKDNDPHGEHDCALFDWQRYRIMFKIDYYDQSMRYHSDDATDPNQTVRVMTVMLASER